MTRVWKIAPGAGAEDWNLFQSTGCIGIGWLEQQDFVTFKSSADVLAALELEYGKKAKGAGRGAAEIIWSFLKDIEIGDIVVANHGYNGIVGVGVVLSNYISPMSPENPIRTDESTHRHHVRLVDWIITKPTNVPGKRFFVQQTLKALDQLKLPLIFTAYTAAFPQDSDLKKSLTKLFGDASDPKTLTASDLTAPAKERILTATYRILRDTKLARHVKMMHNYECQICGHTIELTDGTRYAEAHHIKPLGHPHDGDDILTNVICLCPNCHAECDLGINQLKTSKLRLVPGHDIDDKYVDYHNTVIHSASQGKPWGQTFR